MQNLGSLLSKKYKVHLKYFRALEIITKQWDVIMGKISGDVSPESIYYNKLILSCKNPVWKSEIDYFKEQILTKVNDILKRKKCFVQIDDIGILIKISSSPKSSKKKEDVPESFEEKILWNIEKKKKNGEILCLKCKKVFGVKSICRICELTLS